MKPRTMWLVAILFGLGTVYDLQHDHVVMAVIAAFMSGLYAGSAAYNQLYSKLREAVREHIRAHWDAIEVNGGEVH